MSIKIIAVLPPSEEELDFDVLNCQLEGDVNVISDPDLKRDVIEMNGKFSRISFPLNADLKMLVLHLKCSKYFSIQIIVQDKSGEYKSIVATNTRSAVRVTKRECMLPIVISIGTWQIIKVDLHDIVRRAFGSEFFRCHDVQVGGGVTLGKLFFEDDSYADAQLPAFLRVAQNFDSFN